ncbi:class F sortase [Cohnella cellulosilytica]|uniref:Class F sortase n=1 Tax=Cohnella cellulosilytica TaxID=986710 RepID=A0ABW2F8K9_9BACL
MKKALFVILLLVLAVVGTKDSIIQPRNDAISLRSRAVPPMEIQRPKPAPSGIAPARLFIPALDIHADIETVHVLDNGQMGVPESTDKVGYLSNGVLPGAIGNAVMDGHVDSYVGPAVFFSLRTLTKGDIVIVKDERGKAIEFAVEAVETYPTDAAPIGKIFGSTKEPRLNLITCSGKYSRKKREHLERLVVFTKRIG